MEGSLGRKFSGSKGIDIWGILGFGVDIGRSGEIRLVEGFYFEGKGELLKGLLSRIMMCLDVGV